MMLSINARILRRAWQIAAVLAVTAVLGGCGYAESFCGTDPVGCDVHAEYT